MSFIQDTLLKDEKLTDFEQPHWVVYGLPVGLLLFSLVMYLFANDWLPTFITIPVVNMPLPRLLTWLVFLLGLYQLGSAWIFVKFAEYGITDRRVIMKEGMIWRRSLEIFWDKIEAIHVDQSLLGRILNYGTITIIGIGSSKDIFSYIPNPLVFREKSKLRSTSTC